MGSGSNSSEDKLRSRCSFHVRTNFYLLLLWLWLLNQSNFRQHNGVNCKSSMCRKLNSILRIERDWLVKNLNGFFLNLKILMCRITHQQFWKTTMEAVWKWLFLFLLCCSSVHWPDVAASMSAKIVSPTTPQFTSLECALEPDREWCWSAHR